MFSETLLWVFRQHKDDEEHLNAVSTFLHHAFEYSDKSYLSFESLRYVHIAQILALKLTLHYRMIILADETLEMFFNFGLAQSFRLM